MGGVNADRLITCIQCTIRKRVDDVQEAADKWNINNIKEMVRDFWDLGFGASLACTATKKAILEQATCGEASPM